MVRAWVCVAFAGMALAPQVLASGACGGEACTAIATSADGCAVTNKGEKSVSLTTVADETALLMTVLSPGETIKQDKALCAKFARGEARYTAKFVALRDVPDAPDFTLKAANASAAKPAPKPKPTPAEASAAPAPATAAVVVAEVGPATPRFKPAPAPAYPPAPRSKPAAPDLAAAPAATAAPAVAAVAPTAPVAAAPAAPVDIAACGEACATILFKVVDECLWVVNLHPRAVAFEAQAEGKRFNLMLEAADGDKADARAKAPAPKTDTALHMRLHDPFQSAGSGIPIYRAKLGGAAGCIKQRTDVASFSARFVN